MDQKPSDSFTVKGQPDDTFTLLAYICKEYTITDDFTYCVNVLSKGYLQSKNFIGKQATLITNHGKNVHFVLVHGILAGMQYVQHLADGEEYMFLLKSPLTVLKLGSHNRVFRNKDIKQITDEVLLTAGIMESGFTFNTRENYPRYDFIEQYRETDYQFLERMLGHHGIFFATTFSLDYYLSPLFIGLIYRVAPN